MSSSVAWSSAVRWAWTSFAEQAKVLTTAVYDGALIAVNGNYDDVNRLTTELASEHEDWAFVTSTCGLLTALTVRPAGHPGPPPRCGPRWR